MNTHEADPYIQQLVDTAEIEEISATEDIYNSHGVKLIASGTRIDRNVYQKLIKNKLLKPIDSSLKVEGGVDTDYLVKEIKHLSQNDFAIGIVWSAIQDESLTMSILNKITINPALSVKLTVT